MSHQLTRAQVLAKYNTLNKKVNKVVALAPATKQVSIQYSNNVGTAGVILPFAFPTTGDTQYQRQGSSIKNERLEIKLGIAAAQTQVFCRVIVGRTTNVAGALPAVADIIAGRDNAGTALTDLVRSPIRLNKKNFKIISDRTYALKGAMSDSVPATDNVYNDNRSIVKRIKCKGYKTEYGAVANAGNIADVQSGLYWVLLVTDNNTNLMTYVATLTTNFVDA